MKKCIFRISCFVVMCIFLCSFLGCSLSKRREYNYYLDKNNYITGEAVVDKVFYSEEWEELHIWLKDIDDVYVHGGFEIKGKSKDIAMENGVLEKIKSGDRVTFTSAPRIFWNGYQMPIIGLSVGNTVILDVDRGYQNLLALYK